MNIKYLIIGIVFLTFGMLFLIWNMKRPLYNKDDDDGSIKSGVEQLGRKNDDIRGYISAVGSILLGIIFIYKGIIGG